MAVEVADVEPPQDRPLDLGAQLAAHLVEVGVLPHVVDRAGEAAVAVEQGGRVGDGRPAVEVPLGGEGEVHARRRRRGSAAAASRAHGHGTMSVALVATPLRSAS